ncbi:G protein coupled receptor 85-like protein isoform X1 [Saccoglossus kowalevskii]|uniref:G protein coupled receptor 85-like protein n=1 Tax=Saccoglossus kowalevskii TaxID=10224 RepID=D1LX22_SACKO|nr:G protein coupled receptor 85-like protein [Saccoglossus kowalevskii]XP_006816201.1 PREDICTED: G protein coupled receptor 85-like protein isoform X1 [Saccoglossus kowalevskii]ACY92528.1 G protein coupled receptor 85-like protein [Saccoglossus kowalevskii]
MVVSNTTTTTQNCDNSSSSVTAIMAVVAGLDNRHGSDETMGYDKPQTELAVFKTFTLIVIIAVSVCGNGIMCFIVVRDKSLHRPPFYFLLNIALADMLRALHCLSFTASAVSHHGWIYGKAVCQVIAFFNVLLTFGSVFTLFVLAISRYAVFRYHKFHRLKMSFLACLLVILVAWALAIVMAFPPVFGLGSYTYIPREYQCNYDHRFYKSNDTLGFILVLVISIILTHLMYLKSLIFLRHHRKMTPINFVPASSNNWTFYGPGATGRAAANWVTGFAGLGPPPPTLVGFSQYARRSHLHAHFKRESETTRTTYIITLAFLVLWLPYIIYNYIIIFVRDYNFSEQFVAMATWMTYLQVCVNPIICFCCNRNLRKSLMTVANCIKGRNTWMNNERQQAYQYTGER